jgi:phenylalanyl-tRNA synthetase beta chain
VRDAVRETLAGAGLSEVVTSALVSPEQAAEFPPHDDGALATGSGERAGGDVITVANPLSSQHSVLRQSLLGSLLEVVGTNVRHGRADVAVFEIGKGYGRVSNAETSEWWRLGIALHGAAEMAAWNRPGRAYDLDDAKGLIELVCHRLGFGQPAWEPLTDDPQLHPGRAAVVRATGDRPDAHALVGRVGELHPASAERLDLPAAVIVAEVAVAGLAAGRLPAPRGETPSRHPVVERDLAVVVAEERDAASVAAAIRRHGGELLVGVALFDLYRGRPLGDTEKSLAWRLQFQAPDRTLTENEIEDVVGGIAAGLADDVGGRIRS